MNDSEVGCAGSRCGISCEVPQTSFCVSSSISMRPLIFPPSSTCSPRHRAVPRSWPGARTIMFPRAADVPAMVLEISAFSTSPLRRRKGKRRTSHAGSLLDLNGVVRRRAEVVIYTSSRCIGLGLSRLDGSRSQPTRCTIDTLWRACGERNYLTLPQFRRQLLPMGNATGTIRFQRLDQEVHVT